jgi:hypothetical protein
VLLDAGEDPNRYPHSTPLHQAALAGHAEVVRLRVIRSQGQDLASNTRRMGQRGGRTGIEKYFTVAVLARPNR